MNFLTITFLLQTVVINFLLIHPQLAGTIHNITTLKQMRHPRSFVFRLTTVVAVQYEYVLKVRQAEEIRNNGFKLEHVLLENNLIYQFINNINFKIESECSL